MESRHQSTDLHCQLQDDLRTSATCSAATSTLAELVEAAYSKSCSWLEHDMAPDLRKTDMQQRFWTVLQQRLANPLASLMKANCEEDALVRSEQHALCGCLKQVALSSDDKPLTHGMAAASEEMASSIAKVRLVETRAASKHPLEV